MRGRTVLKIGAAVVVAAGVAAAAVIASIDVNQYKGLIVAKVKEATGRDLQLTGDLEMVLGLTPSVRVNGARFGNAPWASDPNMVAVETFEAQVALLPALTGDLQVKRLLLDGVAIFLETDAKGRANWTFGKAGASDTPAPAGGEPMALPSLEEVSIRNARLVVKDDGNVITTLALENLDLSAEGREAPLTVALKGAYDGLPFDARGVLGPLSRLTAGGAPYPVALTGTVGGVAVAADGKLAEPLAGRGADLAVTLEATTLAGLEPLTGPLPALPPLALKGVLKGGGADWALSDMTLKAGRSTVAGTLSLALAKAKPVVRANLQAALVDLGELLPKGGDAAQGQAPAAKGDRVFSSDPLPLDGLDAANVTFDLEVARLVLPDGIALEGLGAKGHLRDGRLAVDPAQARLGGGIVKGTLIADASSGKGLAVSADISGDKVVLGTLFADMARSDLLTGAPTNLALDVKAAGASLAGLMGSLDGTVRLSVGEGRINQALIDWAGADVINQLAETLNPLAEKREYADMICAAVNLRARDGVIEYDRAIALETTRMSVVSSGAIDLGAEKLDVAVRPYPKDGVGISAGKLAEMVRLRGSLAAPQVAADMAGVARTAVSVVGALATGGASLVAEGLLGHASADPQPCATALSGKAPPAKAQPQQQQQQPASPLDAPGKVIEGIGGGLNQLLGR
ncbi:AsmA family protein [Novispirillum sp. DQ9]|uniref:AsmA family protein n=1 Tax=Novispirillum sp. DQ9 TaxID=3398612 RepID=UPI003C7B67C1